jgi:hypothetical protein
MTAGHNALRGSGPDQKRAFDNAVAQVGCPDRRIDRLCITCCITPVSRRVRHKNRGERGSSRERYAFVVGLGVPLCCDDPLFACT